MIENEEKTLNRYRPHSVMITDTCAGTRLEADPMAFFPSISKGVVIEVKKMLETKIDRK